MQSGLGTIVCKFGSVPAICLREEAICAKVYRRTDGETDGRRTPHDCISSWNELKIHQKPGFLWESHLEPLLYTVSKKTVKIVFVRTSSNFH